MDIMGFHHKWRYMWIYYDIFTVYNCLAVDDMLLVQLIHDADGAPWRAVDHLSVAWDYVSSMKFH